MDRKNSMIKGVFSTHVYSKKITFFLEIELPAATAEEDESFFWKLEFQKKKMCVSWC